VPTPTWNVKRDAFLNGLDEVLKSLPSLTTVPVEKLQEAQAKYRAALDEIGGKEKETTVLLSKIADLEKCKNKDEANAVARKYSTTQEQFEKLVQGAKGTLEKVKQITAAALFAEQAGHPCFPGDGEWPEAMNALEIQEITRESNRVYPRFEHIRVSRAQAALRELDEFLKAEVNAEFLFKLEQELEFPPSIANKEFWHRYLRYV
jgi:class 3 adenylate cyclase